MKQITFALAACLLFTAFSSCNKIIPVQSGFPNPLTGDNQVADFHIDIYDGFFTNPPYLFDKTFDPSGKILKEIAFSFNDDIGVGDLPTYTYDLLVESKGNVVYLIEKGAADTAFRLYLNAQGRPDSCIGTVQFIPDQAYGTESEYYYYKDSRFLAVKDELKNSSNTIVYASIDTMKYDSYGNPLSFRGNSYQYDYSRAVSLQFLCDDFTGGDDLFYLMEYLGYFQEITSPANLRTTLTNATDPTGASETDQLFDKEGRLISYTMLGQPETITWNSK